MHAFGLFNNVVNIDDGYDDISSSHDTMSDCSDEFKEQLTTEVWYADEQDVVSDFNQEILNNDQLCEQQQNSQEDNQQQQSFLEHSLLKLFLIVTLLWSSLHGIAYNSLEHLFKLLHFFYSN